MKSGLIGCLVAFTVLGCGGTTALKTPSRAAQRNVAGRFATAVLRGDDVGARALLVHSDDGALASLVQWAAAPWRNHHASIRLPARRTGMFAVHIRRGPWGYLHEAPTADARIDSLAELPGVLP